MGASISDFHSIFQNVLSRFTRVSGLPFISSIALIMSEIILADDSVCDLGFTFTSNISPGE